MPSDTFNHAVLITSPRDEVWDRLQHPETWEAIPGVDDITNPTTDGDGALSGFDFSTRVAGRSYRGTATITISRRPERMRNEIETTELRGAVDIKFEENGMDTFLIAEMTVSPLGLLSSIAFPAISAAISAGFADAVETAAKRDTFPEPG